VDLAIDLAGSGYTLTATSGVMTPDASKHFDVARPITIKSCRIFHYCFSDDHAHSSLISPFMMLNQ
jgi:hypothetical protein